MSNSKLTAEQKQFRKQFKVDNPDVQFFSFAEMGVTVAMRATGRSMGEFSVSIMSDTEQKFRRKVGEYWAAHRMSWNEVLPVVMWTDMETVASHIADAITAR